jgi:hypothetical protein
MIKVAKSGAHTLRFLSKSISDYHRCYKRIGESAGSNTGQGTHHDLAKFTFGDITQLNFLHGYGFPGCPVERAWTRLGFRTETVKGGCSPVTYGKPAQTRLCLANHRVATRHVLDGRIKRVIPEWEQLRRT